MYGKDKTKKYKSLQLEKNMQHLLEKMLFMEAIAMKMLLLKATFSSLV